MKEITLRFKVEMNETAEALVEAWLKSQPVDLTLPDGRSAPFTLTYVREREI